MYPSAPADPSSANTGTNPCRSTCLSEFAPSLTRISRNYLHLPKVLVEVSICCRLTGECTLYFAYPPCLSLLLVAFDSDWGSCMYIGLAQSPQAAGSILLNFFTPKESATKRRGTRKNTSHNFLGRWQYAPKGDNRGIGTLPS
jgi:hypothetical protein